jgi:uncharacterized protein (DUF1330 family)
VEFMNWGGSCEAIFRSWAWNARGCCDWRYGSDWAACTGQAQVYLITEIDVKDPDNYAKEFAPKAQATIKAAGGRFVVIGGVAGVGAKPITGLAGEPPKRITIQAWDSMDAISAWYKGADYQAALKIGEKYASFRRYAIEGQ